VPTQTDAAGFGTVPRADRIASAAGWLGPWLAVVGLGLWTSSPDSLSLALAAIGVSGAVLRSRGRGAAWGFALVLLISAVVVALSGHRRVDSVLADFDGYWAARDTAVGALLEEELDRRVDTGLTATDALVEAWMESAEVDAGLVRDLRERNGLSALALYDPFGRLLHWDGVHRGRVPELVQTGQQDYSYHDFPLFGYLYVTSIAGDGSTAVAAFLLRSALPEGLRADVNDFAANFFRETNERIRISEDDPGPWDGIVYELTLRERILSVVVERPEEVERADQMMTRWAGWVAVLVLLAWILLAVGRPRRVANAVVAAGALVLLAAWIPLDEISVLGVLFDAGTFALAGPVSMSLGRFALLGIAGFTFVSVLPRPRVSLPPWAAGLFAAAAFPLLLGWAVAGTEPMALAGSRLEWIVYQVAAAALVSLAAGIAISLSEASRGWAWAAPAAVVLALLLGAGGAGWVWSTAAHPLWWLTLWGLPVAVATVGAPAWSGWRRSMVSWGLGIVIGSTAAIPATWAHRVQARMVVGEERLDELASFSIPSLETSLLNFASVVDSLDRAGSDDVTLLYDGWQLSGLSESGYPVQLQVHRRNGSPGEELRVGVSREAPPPLNSALQQAWREGGASLLHLNRDDARYILTTALSDGDVVAVVAPPFIENSDRSGLGPLLRGVSVEEVDPLTVIPLSPGDPRPLGGVSWFRVGTGWQGETVVDFENDASYQAQYLVALPGPVLAIARATLLLVLNLTLFIGLWLVGQGLVNDVGRRDLRLSPFVISFRARVTLALFGFFTLANALFGAVAYQTLSEASRRSARVIAERVAEDAAGWYRALEGRMERLASQVGAELLEYREGELREGSIEELVELGLYEGWTPHEVFEVLNGREAISAFTETTLGRWEYVTAYRRLPDGDILAVQVPLEAGTDALQTTDLVELLLFLVIVGAALSLGLAMLAGRALTRPIAALQSASERVGAGDLGIRLPEHRADEFGAVFRAFNRMVGRVRRARRQLVRTSKRTQLIMDEAAVGMVALDPAGRVTLANPRAEELLGGEIVVGGAIPRDGKLAEELMPVLEAFLDASHEEADAEIQAGDRRVRVRIRRLGSDGSQRGVVLAMDDVTDELRAERVLAWGEMARQVAHEVKNPLTPIKLSVQHVRRAWEDRHPDFNEILLRNADAMLSEIERLDEIAQSFSRFGAPGENALPITAVSVEAVVGEVMALYGAPPAGVRFVQDVEEGLPDVLASSAELKEVLVNLLENARLAGGDDTVVSVMARRGNEDTVLLTVVDDGSGIPNEVLPRVFEPQFSTRSTGTGLGLAIVQRLVSAWGGDVSVRSRVGEGTAVEVVLRVWSEGFEDEPGSSEREPAS
jgi:two-component system nitrogen regulation sensor histidine kinase NtrY